MTENEIKSEDTKPEKNTDSESNLKNPDHRIVTGEKSKIDGSQVGGSGNFQLKNISHLHIERPKTDIRKYEKDALFDIKNCLYPEEDLIKIKNTFVPSKSFSRLKDIINGRFIVIAGSEEAGKLSAALFLGARLKDEKSINSIFIISDSEKMLPANLLEKLPSKSFLVVENAFAQKDHSIIRKILIKGERAGITHIRNTLNDSFLVSVTNTGLKNIETKTLQDWIDNNCILENYAGPDPEEILSKYIDIYLTEKQIEKAKEIFDNDEFKKGLQRLKSARKISKFVEYTLSKIEISQDIKVLNTYLIKEIHNILDIDSEVENYFDSLSDECKSIAFTLSLFNGISENAFWPLHNFFTPKKNTDRSKEKKREEKETYFFTTPKRYLLDNIRASVERKRINASMDETFLTGDTVISKIKFNDARYADIINSYVVTNFPEYAIAIINKLVKSLPSLPQMSLVEQIAIGNALGKLGSAKWHSVMEFSESLSINDHPTIREIVGFIFETAIQNERINADVANTLLLWSRLRADAYNWKFIWTAASSFKQVGLSNIKFALSGLKMIIVRIDLLNEDEYVDLIINSVLYSYIVLALKGFIPEIIEGLNDIIVDEEVNDDDNILKIVSAIWHHLAWVFIDLAAEMRSQNEMLAVVAEDSELQNHISSLISSIFIKWHPVKINGKPLSTSFFEIAEEWIMSVDERHLKFVIKLMENVRSKLKKSSNICFKYFNSYLKRFWYNEKQPTKLKSATEIIIEMKGKSK